MSNNVIDVWAAESFDPELAAVLEESTDLIRSFLYYKDQDLGGDHSLSRPENVSAADYLRLVEAIARAMEGRTIRAWHYTRMTDAEVDALRRGGVHLSTLESLRARLDAQVAVGALDSAAANALLDMSPLNNGQMEIRAGRFWMMSHPLAADDGGVEPLMAHWGGEVATMRIEDATLLGQLAMIGAPRILEIRVPMDVTEHSYRAAEAVVATFARGLGCIVEKVVFDLYTIQPLPPESVLAVHTQHEPAFAQTARGYPPGFVDVSAGDDD